MSNISSIEIATAKGIDIMEDPSEKDGASMLTALSGVSIAGINFGVSGNHCLTL